MAFVFSIFFSDFLNFDTSLLLLTVTLRGVSNKHCLLSLFINPGNIVQANFDMSNLLISKTPLVSK